MKDFPLSLYHISKSTSSQVCVFCTFPLLVRVSLSGGKNQFLRKKHNRIVNRKAPKNKDFSTKSTAFSTLLCKSTIRQKVQKTDFFHLPPTAFFLSRPFSRGENRVAADSVGSCLSKFVGRCAFEQRGVASLFESFALRSAHSFTLARSLREKNFLRRTRKGHAASVGRQSRQRLRSTRRRRK